MLFNSYIFILIFLPVVLCVVFLLSRFSSKNSVIAWLTAASLFFYAWWNPLYVILLIGSIVFNYVVGKRLGGGCITPHPNPLPEGEGVDAATGHRMGGEGKWLLVFGVAINLLLLGYYKYANFFVDNYNAVAGTGYEMGTIILPLAISFFTFQQVAFLVDAWRGEVEDFSFLRYCLFVTFFPQLIAGPIVRHTEMVSQYTKESMCRMSRRDMSVGITVFFMGLFKKAVIADSVARYSGLVFGAAGGGVDLTFFEAWGGALAYTFQIYFDFSGYSDMAIGLACMLGLKIPLNFFSPYRARNIIEFWRRWHISLSRFLRDYLYIPLGGNRKGSVRRYTNVMITMILGGLWHGASWTFVIWGALHGGYMLAHHAWRGVRGKGVWECGSVGVGGSKGVWEYGGMGVIGNAAGVVLTFVCVVVAWVFFRADSPGSALCVLKGMSGANGFVLPESYQGYLGPMGTWLSGVGVRFEMIPYFKGLSEMRLLGFLMAVV